MHALSHAGLPGPSPANAVTMKAYRKMNSQRHLSVSQSSLQVSFHQFEGPFLPATGRNITYLLSEESV